MGVVRGKAAAAEAKEAKEREKKEKKEKAKETKSKSKAARAKDNEHEEYLNQLITTHGIHPCMLRGVALRLVACSWRSVLTGEAAHLGRSHRCWNRDAQVAAQGSGAGQPHQGGEAGADGCIGRLWCHERA